MLIPCLDHEVQAKWLEYFYAQLSVNCLEAEAIKNAIAFDTFYKKALSMATQEYKQFCGVNPKESWLNSYENKSFLMSVILKETELITKEYSLSGLNQILVHNILVLEDRLAKDIIFSYRNQYLQVI